MEDTNYVFQETKRVEKLFALKHKEGFKNKTHFANWFVQTLNSQNFCCYYCETSIFNIKQLIHSGRLKVRKTRYGVRGPILEIDKMSNNKGYYPENCVLSCYYCNNDKSYTLDAEAYKEYFGYNRREYFKLLLSNSLTNEPQKIKQLFKDLITSTLYQFNEMKTLNIPCKHGVYIIYNPSGMVSHVGNTRTGENGLCQRLNDHLKRKSSFAKKFLMLNGLSLKSGFTFRFIEIIEPRERVLLEFLACGELCPEYIGTYEK